jgi:predicted RecA/RadA family phage recombinase
MKNFQHIGDVMTVTAPAVVVSGGPVSVGVLFGVAMSDAASGAAVEIQTRGVFTLAKTSAQAWTVGQAIYYIPSTGLCTTATTTGNLFIGVAAAVAANPSSTGSVRLNGAAPTAVT